MRKKNFLGALFLFLAVSATIGCTGGKILYTDSVSGLKTIEIERRLSWPFDTNPYITISSDEIEFDLKTRTIIVASPMSIRGDDRAEDEWTVQTMKIENNKLIIYLDKNTPYIVTLKEEGQEQRHYIATNQITTKK